MVMIMSQTQLENESKFWLVIGTRGRSKILIQYDRTRRGTTKESVTKMKGYSCLIALIANMKSASASFVYRHSLCCLASRKREKVTKYLKRIYILKINAAERRTWLTYKSALTPNSLVTGSVRS